MAFRFEELEIWKDAVRFSGKIYDVTDTFPREEIFGLTAQLRRAATSISLNIAEGTSRSSRKEFSYFLEIATGSVFEVVTGLAIARDRDLMVEDGYKQVYSDAEALAKKISTFRKTILRKGSRSS